VLKTKAAHVLVLKYDFRGTSLVTLHNFADKPETVHFSLEGRDAATLVDIFGNEHCHAAADGMHHTEVKGYGYRWLRVGAVDNALRRSPF
jgi:maltose alpha-D-glucosyltransferase/alpha-amylase